MLWFFFCASYLSDCPCSVSFGVWHTCSWIVEAPLFSLHFSSLPYSFRRCHLSSPESMFLSETHVQLPIVHHHWVVPLTPQVQGALDWTYFLQAPGPFLMLDLHAMFYCFLFLNPPTVRGCFLLTLLTVSSLGHDPTSIICISLLTGLSPAILTAPICFPWNHQDPCVKSANGDISVLKNVECLPWSTGWASLFHVRQGRRCGSVPVSLWLNCPLLPYCISISCLVVPQAAHAASNLCSQFQKKFFLLLFTQWT